ncbi:MAG TPA: glycosyltransferase family 39 protein, partial [Thermoanaerobaculia bacterium]|nr:glycosyltransferase family 39 protein [Thermoanaerobaculia bacterium]
MFQSPPRGARLGLVAVLVAAAVLRLVHWWTLRDQPFVGQPILDSAEYDRWARQIASGDWRGEGAFFQAPFYPYLIAAVYVVAGSRLSAVYLLQIAAAVAAVWALWRCGLRLAGWQVGLVGAALAAFCGVLVFHDVLLLKESLATSAMAFLLLALVSAREPGTEKTWWLVAGALFGVLVELRENALLLLPLLLGLAFARSQRRQTLAACALLLGGLLLILAPIAVRNVAMTGEPLLTSFQGGVNYWIGNNPDADGTYRPLVAGRQVPERERAEAVRLAEQASGRKLSPREVSRYWLHRALAWTVSEPGAFLRLQVRKLALFWSPYEWPDAVDYAWLRHESPVLRAAFVERGTLSLLALAGLWLVRGDLRRWAPVLVLLFGWMAVTVAFFLFSRYRLPAVPPLALLAAVPLARLGNAIRDWRARALDGDHAAAGDGRGRTLAIGAGTLAVVAAFIVPHALMLPPRLDLVHGNLGRLAEQRGDAIDAEAHYRAALAAAPDDLLALLGLGNAAARQRRYDEALALYRHASAAYPGSPEALANVGAAEL